MAEDFTRADDVQLAEGTSEGEACTDNGGNGEACAGGGAGDGVAAGAASDAAQVPEAVALVQPPAGSETTVQAVEGQTYDLQFDPRLAEVRVLDADGDQDLDVVLVFNAGRAEESRIVFRDMVEAAQSGSPPILQIGESQFGADLMVQQAQALAGEQPTLETAAPPAAEAEGTGATRYDDNLGRAIDLLNPQGVIPPVEMVFPLPDPIETAEDAPLTDTPLPPEILSSPPTAFGSSVTSVEGDLIGIPGSPATVGGFFYAFDVGEENDISDNIHGTDPEDGVTTDFTITSLPEDGVLVIDRDSDGSLDEAYGLSNVFIPGAQPLPSGGVEIDSDDTVFYFLPIEEVIAIGGFPDSVIFTYFTTDSDGLNSNNATIEVGFPTVPSVTFDITVTSEDTGNDAPTQAATISEENDGDDLGTYAITLSGDALNGPNTASVTVSVSGDAEDADFTQAVVDAIAAGAGSAGVAFVDNLDGTVTLTWNPSSDATVLVDLEALDDELTDSPETLTLSLGGATIGFGTVSIDAAKQSADLTIEDIDAEVSFDITVTPGSISEDAEESATFTVTMSGNLPAGNTATVDIGLITDGDGNTQAADGVDYLDAIVAAITAGVAGTDIAFDGTTLTFTGGGDTTFDFTVTAQDDEVVEGVEDINVQLSNDTVIFGSSSIGQDQAEVEITELDAEVSFDISVTPDSISEDAEESATFTVTMSGDLPAGNTATVDIGLITDGDGNTQAADGVDYLDALVAAITAGVSGTDIAFDGTTLTFTGGGDTSFDFTVTAQDDQAVEGVEDINVQLSNDTVQFGTSSIGQDLAEVEITELDAGVTFDIAVTPGSISEDAEESATFTVTLSGDLAVGNTATVDIGLITDGDGNTQAADGVDYLDALVAAITAGVSSTDIAFDGTTLTFTGGGDTSFDFTVTAQDDQAVEGVEDINVQLSNDTVQFGTSSIGQDLAEVEITELDAAVLFDITVSSEDAGNDAPTQAATIVEESDADDLGTYAIALSGDALLATNTASVTVTIGGDAEDADFTQAVADAIEAGANSAGVAFVNNLNGTVTLTWDVGSTATVLVDLEAVDDAILDSPETLTLSLSGAVVDHGTASVDGAKQSADLTITDGDQVVFDITVTSEDTGDDTPTQSATVSEENAGDDTGTFRISATNTLLQGSDTASVTVTMSGSADDADFTQAVIAAIAAEATSEGIAILSQDATSIALEWGATDPSFIDVDLTAFDDEVLEAAETLTLSLGDPSANATVDPAKQSADLNILFDDVPDAGSSDALVVDETAGVDTDGIEDDVDPTAAFNGLSAENREALTVTLGLTAGFVGVLSVAQQSFAFDFGQDGPGSISLDTVASGTASGLFDTASGEQVFLFTEDGLLVGRVGTAGAADESGDIAFVVVMEETGTASGIDNTSEATTTIAQYRAIVHDDPSDHDEANGGSDVPGGVADEFILVDYTVVDVHGDPASGAVTVSFEDDGLTANPDTNSVTAGMVAYGDVAAMPAPVIDGDVVNGGVAAGDAADALGADGFASIAWQGETGGTVAGSYGTLTVGTDGTYSYDLDDENLAVVGLQTGQSLDDVFTYTITDGDGDSSTTTLTITIDGSNDGPTITDPAAVRVSEEGLPAGNPDTTGDLDTTDSDTDTSSVSATDPDGDTLTFSLGDPGAVLTSGGQPVTWSGVGGDTLVGSVGSTTIITITVDGSGSLAVDLDGPIDHPDATEEDDLTFTVPVNVSDGNGKSDSTTLSVTIEDDAPVAVPGEMVEISVDEDELSTSDGDLSDGVTDGDGDTDEATFSDAALQALVTTGADEPLTFSLDQTVAGGAVQTTAGDDVFSNGDQVFFNDNAGVLEGLAGGRVVFTVSDNGDGSFTFDLLDQLDHSGGGDEETLVLDLTAAFRAVDADGDAVTLEDNSIKVSVENDVPDADLTQAVTIRIDEDDLDNLNYLGVGTGSLGTSPNDGNADGSFTDPTDGFAFAAVTDPAQGLASLAIAGADEPASFSLEVTAAPDPTTLTSNGSSISIASDGSLLTGTADDGRVIFELTVNQDGTYEFKLFDQLDHVAPPAGTSDENFSLQGGGVNIDLSGYVQVTDADGDAVTLNAGNFVVEVRDDVPQAQDNNADVETEAADRNIVIVFDRSGSMTADPSVAGFSERIDLARAAVASLLASADATGQVNVLIVDFASDASTSGWLSGPGAVDQANAYLSSIFAGGYTNYEAAIQLVQDSYTTDFPGDLDQNLVYFLSDGQPTRRSNDSTNDGGPNDGDNDGLTDAEEAAWEQFLIDNNIDTAFAVGVGSGTDVDELEEIAFPNGDPDNPIEATDESLLVSTLLSTLSVNATGNVLSDPGPDPDNLVDTFGADESGRIVSITVDTGLGGGDGRTTFTYDPLADEITNEDALGTIAGSVLVISTDMGGDFTFGFLTGDYSYATQADNGGGVELFDYTIEDADGDQSSAVLTIDIPTSPDAAGLPLITGTNSADTLNGAAGDVAEILAGDDGHDTLNGFGGNDLLFGGDGTDTLNGGAGDDILVGGLGDDFIIGGEGADIINVGANDSSGTPDPDDFNSQDTVIYTSVLDAGDTIHNFDASAGRTGTDVIDLSDLFDSLEATLGNLDEAARLARVEIANPGGPIAEVNVNADGNPDFEVTVVTVDLLPGGTLDLGTEVVVV